MKITSDIREARAHASASRIASELEESIGHCAAMPPSPWREAAVVLGFDGGIHLDTDYREGKSGIAFSTASNPMVTGDALAKWMMAMLAPSAIKILDGDTVALAVVRRVLKEAEFERVNSFEMVA